jgi:exodeoxyribonuclease VII large subunit
VTALTAALRDLLETRFADVWVEGEISNCRPWHTGHLYFTLKDAGAQVKAVMFRSAVRALRFKPEDGLRVIVRGPAQRVRPEGRVPGRVRADGAARPRRPPARLRAAEEAPAGRGPLRRRRASGRLPALPRRIGIVTSLDGAALRDIINVISRRHPNVTS